jgi:putative ABC transport system ATP-binding protein
MPSSALPDLQHGPGLGLVIDGIEVRYSREAGAAPALAVLNLAVPAGAHVGITGPSGSGKTTLLHVMAGIERPRQGKVRWGEVDITALGDGERARWRRDTIGMVFQDFQLIGALSALDNVLLPWQFDHFTVPAEVRARAARLLESVKVEKSRQARVLSRGEQQRVSVARALLRRPSVLVADEPTASLDADNGNAVADLLVGAARDSGATLVIVSHDPALLARLSRVHRLAGGRLLDVGDAA